MALDGVAGTATQITYLAMTMFKSTTHVEMMMESFPEMDRERERLAMQGSWMNRTASLARYAVVDTYA